MDAVNHAILLQKQIDKLIIDIVSADGLGQSELVRRLNKILKDMPKVSSEVCNNIANALLKIYQDQGFLEGEMYGGRSGDEEILNYYNRILSLLPKATIDAYNRLNNEVINMLSKGDVTTKQAVDILVNASDYRGLTIKSPSSGRNYKFETLIAMHVRNQLREATNHASDDIADMLGTNVFQVDSHAGARPKCALDQGKLYSDYGGTFEDINANKYPVYPWSITSIGQPDGLFGINCRHIKYPMVQGFSIPSKEDPMLKVIKQNQKKINNKTIRASL